MSLMYIKNRIRARCESCGTTEQTDIGLDQNIPMTVNINYNMYVAPKSESTEQSHSVGGRVRTSTRCIIFLFELNTTFQQITNVNKNILNQLRYKTEIHNNIIITNNIILLPQCKKNLFCHLQCYCKVLVSTW